MNIKSFEENNSKLINVRLKKWSKRGKTGLERNTIENLVPRGKN